VLLPGLGNPQQAARLAGEMLSLLSDPFMIDGSESNIGVSIGVSIFPTDGTMAPELLKKADMAMYRAKATGRGRIVFFEESMNVAQQERAMLERELRQAIARKQLALHYQPRVALADGKLAGVEALLRWQHPELGWVSPERFIPLAEEIGLIDELGHWVLGQVCVQRVAWEAAGFSIPVVSVNVSGRQFKSGRLVKQVRQTLQATGIAPEALELEVTEGTLFDNVEEVIDQLNQLKQTGVTIALDDFGRGYSSMTYLQRLPVDILKVDQSFIQDLDRDEGANSIVYSIITLAHALRMSVVAEGVETQRQVDLLRAWDCEQVQGYYYSRPVTAAELEELLEPSQPAELN
jgi:EAL domain-containing protein (putative c-di-GMP-specific phosphodiesterase class I)